MSRFLSDGSALALLLLVQAAPLHAAIGTACLAGLLLVDRYARGGHTRLTTNL